jgi:O-antigen/teichoic acid export membrane protein
MFSSWFSKKSFTFYLAGNISYQLCFILSEILILRIIDVEVIGIWQWVLLLQSYALISRLGILNSFNREYPYLLQRKENSKSFEILAVTKFHLSISVVLQILVFCTLAVYYWIYVGISERVILLFTISFYILADSYVNFSEAILRSKSDFKKIAITKMSFAVILLISVFLPYSMDFYGFVLRIILLQCIFLVTHYHLNKTLSNIKQFFSLSVWKSLFNDGWRVWLWSYLKSFHLNLPKIYIANFLGVTALGYFTPINWVLLAFSLITSSLASFIYPTLSRKYAEGEKNLVWKTYTIYATVFLAAVPLAIIGYFILPAAIKYILPNYIDIIGAMQLVAISSVFDVFVLIGSSWVALKDYRRMFFMVAMMLFVRVLSLIWVNYQIDVTLFTIAKSMVFSSVFISLGLFIIVIHQHLFRNKNAKT